MAYVVKGEGETILSVHGIFGGYDQAYDSVKSFSSQYRIVAPSRFGYLGSDVKGDGTPAEQAKAFVELLDKLGIDKVYVLGQSAGGTIAIRFALDYPERVKGLILFSSAMPFTEKPEKYAEYAGPPSFLVNDCAMFLISPLFEPIMGMEPSTIYSMLPISERKRGVALDASINNPDMARNFHDYKIESLQAPTLILAAKDDKLVGFEQTEQAVKRFPNRTSIFFETGGHLMVGHSEKIERAVVKFIDEND
ncbi:alpha/beta hydrolase [Candidatus Saccharibacteria bacterium]|nr:alpha/beta hydrolase [Candidatus Saccharibacteria bacterium]